MSTTEAKHTPELWHIASMGNHQRLICKEKTGENIAVAFALKNAPLIAAAPELLAALKNAAIALRFYAAWMLERSGKEKTTYPYGQNCEKVAEAMIAK